MLEASGWRGNHVPIVVKHSEQGMKFKPKFFRVATEGAATDGRTITREWIQQMAASYDPKKFGARIWLEHLRGIHPDSSFRAYGDVLALEAREGEGGKLELFAQLDPTDELVALNKKRQKVYSSIEINPDFTGSGKAYLTGLGVTDSPASLGTEMLQFSQQQADNSPLAGRKQDKGNLFSVATALDLDFEEDHGEQPSRLSESLKNLKAMFKKQNKATDQDLTELVDLVGDVVKHSAEQEQELASVQTAFKDQGEELAELRKDFNSFKQLIESTDAGKQHRPPATGDNGLVQTDC
ncbi:GPO family capsid scaffolding protein [Alcaligenes sp. 13f]|uniref:GPO family capsid scaffolding protein n=1 Tax=Alcaligenes sp. 13f TaxID=2841924 RepID=UPI001CF6F75F|nr:GPO family capsid scaffolding protein [Alcaligenes sp. 13f]